MTVESWEAVEQLVEARREWLDNRVRFANLSLPSMEALSLSALQQWLQVLGGALTYLQAEQGSSKARAKGLQEEYDLKLARAKGALEDLPKSASEAQKEAKVLASDTNLWEVRWKQVEADAIVAMQDGYIRAFDKAWDTISRQITALTREMEQTTGRTN